MLRSSAHIILALGLRAVASHYLTAPTQGAEPCGMEWSISDESDICQRQRPARVA